MTTRMLAVAHRAGNDLGTLRSALDAGADLVEADVHAYRGRLEVRHRKSLGPWLLWDHGELVRRRDTRLLELHELLSAVGDDPRLMLDLKGLHLRLASSLARALPPDSRITVCTQHWWMLRAFRSMPRLRLVLSAGSRRGLRRLRRRVRRQPVYGVSVHRRLLTPPIVAELHRGAEVVLTWPVDSADALQDAHRLGVTGVIGKDLAALH